MADYFEEVLHEASLGYVLFPISDRTVQTGRQFARHTLPYRDGQGGEELLYVDHVLVVHGVPQ